MRDDRRAVIGDDDDLHAVGEQELAGAALWSSLRGRSQVGRDGENGDA
jgi:hypothetical protein